MTKRKRKIETKKHIQNITEKPKVDEIEITKSIQPLEKVEPMPQTYIEDTFDLNNQESNVVEIKNEIRKKEKQFISKNNLLNDPMFINKLQKTKSRIENNKGFDFLLDFATSSKIYKSFSIDDKYDDFDILLEEISNHFSIRLSRLELKYDDYIKIVWYFERLKNLYNEFKHSELIKRKELSKDLETMKLMSPMIRWYLF